MSHTVSRTDKKAELIKIRIKQKNIYIFTVHHI